MNSVSFSLKEKPARDPPPIPKKRNLAQNKSKHGKRWDEGGRRSGNGSTLSYPTVWWSGRYGVTEFVVTSPLTFWKKVRAKDRISPPVGKIRNYFELNPDESY